MVFVTYLKRFMAVAILSGVATFAFAEDAPVFEVDNYPPPFDHQQQPEIVSGGMINDSTELDVPAPPPQTAYAPPPVERPHVHAPPQEFYTPPSTRSMSTSERLAKIERQLNHLQQTNAPAKSEELQKEVQSLRGQVEELTHQLQQAQNQQD